MRNLLIMISLIVSGLALTACGAGRVEITRERGSDVFQIMAELNEADIAGLVEQALDNRNDPLLKDPVVDLQAGQIVVTGTAERRDGGGEVDGRLVIVPSVVDGQLAIEITEVDIDGTDLNDDRIERFNNNLSDRLARRAEQRNRQINFTSVSVTDDLLTLSLEATRQQQ